MSEVLQRIADFDLSEEQRLVRRSVRDFAEKEIAPFVEEYEREARYPTELIQKLVPLGLIAPMIPEEFGGSYVDVVTYGLICEEIARVDWVVASVVSVTNSLVAGSILRSGSEAQQQRWLPPLDPRVTGMRSSSRSSDSGSSSSSSSSSATDMRSSSSGSSSSSSNRGSTSTSTSTSTSSTTSSTTTSNASTSVTTTALGGRRQRRARPAALAARPCVRPCRPSPERRLPFQEAT